MPRPRRTSRADPSRAEPPHAVLGLAADASAAEIVAARRRLAKQLHPDAGGTDAAMQRVNEAAAAALAAATARGPRQPDPADRNPGRRVAADRGAVRSDHPSFTVEALPAEAFEGLLVVAAWLGDLIDDDPPYALEVALTDPIRGWCQLVLVPDADASTVSMSVAADPGAAPPDLDRVRDAWIEGLNRLDWTEPSSPRPPS